MGGGGGWWWANPLQTLPQGLVFTFDFDFDFDFDPDPDPDPELDNKSKKCKPISELCGYEATHSLCPSGHEESHSLIQGQR